MGKIEKICTWEDFWVALVNVAPGTLGAPKKLYAFPSTLTNPAQPRVYMRRI